MSADQLLGYSDTPVWKDLIDSPLTTDERVSLITDLFSNRDEIDSLEALSESDAQSVIDAIDEVLVHPRVRMTDPLTRALTLRSRRVGIGWHAAVAPEEVPGHIVQDMQPPLFDPSVNTNPTPLQSDGTLTI